MMISNKLYKLKQAQIAVSVAIDCYPSAKAVGCAVDHLQCNGFVWQVYSCTGAVKDELNVMLKELTARIADEEAAMEARDNRWMQQGIMA
jgi:hypothetical protein